MMPAGEENVCLVACESRGVCTSLFCDFGLLQRGTRT